MNCIKCKTKMDKGLLTMNGQWTQGNKLVKLLRNEGKIYNNEVTMSYRCPKCGYIEQYSTVQHKAE